ncbi:phytase [Cyathus striatus]|nr:phytase [Cyathus striatus]
MSFSPHVREEGVPFLGTKSMREEYLKERRRVWLGSVPSQFDFGVLYAMLGVFVLGAILTLTRCGHGAAVLSSSSSGGSFLPEDIFALSWAQYSPWFPAAAYTPPPSDCQITQVNLLERHGARFPTSGATKRILSAVGKLQSAGEFTDPRLDFLRNFTYDLGQDNLVRFGALQAQQSGTRHAARYAHLSSPSLNTTNIPFIRASGSQRVVDSATNWTLGWYMTTRTLPAPPLILSEDGNDTLDDAMCPSAGSSDPQTNTWIDTFFPPLTAYLNTHAPGANLSTSDVYNLMSLCPFETLAKEARSPFCALFEGGVLGTGWEGFEYEGDLDKYYGTGYGQPLGKIQGVGYTNELLARLTLSPVQDHTQTNSTLDSSPLTFPLDRKFYADFSHDNEMIPIYASIGLFAQSKDLDVRKADKRRNWRANLLVPFGSGMVVEKMVCVRSHSSSLSGGTKGEYVRILVNDALQPLSFCGAGEEGLCELDAFVESQGYARRDGGGDFERCFST